MNSGQSVRLCDEKLETSESDVNYFHHQSGVRHECNRHCSKLNAEYQRQDTLQKLGESDRQNPKTRLTSGAGLPSRIGFDRI
jgi:hypothetical protein